MRLAPAVAALFLLSSLGAQAYHIGSSVGSPPVVDPTTPARNWSATGAALIVCETDGPHDVRNPYSAGPQEGFGGLCTLGETKAGTWNDGQVAATAAVHDSTMGAPPAGRLVKFDVLLPDGSTDVGFHAEVGGYDCHVLPLQAVYYDALYAWWWFSPGSHNTPAEQDGFHGHAAMFVDPDPRAVAGTALVDAGGGAGVVAPNGPLAAPCGAPYGGPVFLDNE